jgi:hypothetical protein
MDPAAFDVSGLNWLGLLLAWLALIVIGFVWYAKWFPTGRKWMQLQGMDPDNMPKPPGGAMAVSMLLMLVGSFLMMFVFAHTNMAYQDAFRNEDTGGSEGYDLSVMDGVIGALFTWLGFIVPLNLNAVAFDRKPWSLFFINAGYYLVGLVVAGILLTTVGSFG